MFKRIHELFKSKKAEPKASGISLKDLPAWLDTEEQSCIHLRSEQINESRELIDKARKDIIQLMKDFGAEDDSAEPLHPKVEQVNRHNLPQFKRKVEAALDVEFSEDDEKYYQQVAELINSCFKAYRGPGRYLHHLYSDEVKLFRQLMDQIGKELNLLTEAIKNSRIRLARIQAIRESLKQIRITDDELTSANQIRDELDRKRNDFVSRKEHLTSEKEKYETGQEYSEYAAGLKILDSGKQRTSDLFEVLDGLMRTALPVWKKVLRIVQDEKKKDDEKVMDRLIQLVVLQNYTDPDFPPLIRSTAGLLFRSIENETIPLKNSFEKSLFVNSSSYVDQITGAVNSWIEADQIWQRNRDLLASHPAAASHASFEAGILDLDREIKHCDEEGGKILGRVHHLDREKDDAMKVIREEMHELSGGMITIPDSEEAAKEET